MKTLTSNEVSALSQIYLLANTPAYLYRKLRASNVVQRMSDDMTPKSLEAMIRKVSDKKKRGIEDIAKAYAAVVALITKKPGPPSEEVLSRIESTDLDWAKSIVGFFRSSPSSTTVASFTVPAQKPKAANGQRSPSITSKSFILTAQG